MTKFADAIRAKLIACAAFIVFIPLTAMPQGIQSPEAFAGFRMGADYTKRS